MNARKIKIAEVMRDAIAKTNASVTVEIVHVSLFMMYLTIVFNAHSLTDHYNTVLQAPPAEDVATPL